MKSCREATDCHQPAPSHAVDGGLSGNSAPTIKAFWMGTVPLGTRCVGTPRRDSVVTMLACFRESNLTQLAIESGVVKSRVSFDWHATVLRFANSISRSQQPEKGTSIQSVGLTIFWEVHSGDTSEFHKAACVQICASIAERTVHPCLERHRMKCSVSTL